MVHKADLKERPNLITHQRRLASVERRKEARQTRHDARREIALFDTIEYQFSEVQNVRQLMDLIQSEGPELSLTLTNICAEARSGIRQLGILQDYIRANPGLRDERGQSLLHHAAATNVAQLVHTCLDAGIDANTRSTRSDLGDIRGELPIVHALRYGIIEDEEELAIVRNLLRLTNIDAEEVRHLAAICRIAIEGAEEDNAQLLRNFYNNEIANLFREHIGEEIEPLPQRELDEGIIEVEQQQEQEEEQEEEQLPQRDLDEGIVEEQQEEEQQEEEQQEEEQQQVPSPRVGRPNILNNKGNQRGG